MAFHIPILSYFVVDNHPVNASANLGTWRMTSHQSVQAYEKTEVCDEPSLATRNTKPRVTKLRIKNLVGVEVRSAAATQIRLGDLYRT